MEKITIFESDYCCLWFYPDLKIVHSKFLKYSGGKIFRDLLTKGIEVFIQNNCIKWLSDDRYIGIVNQEDAAWSREVWYGKLSKAGWKYWALVRPESTLGKITFKKSINKVDDSNMKMKIFHEPEDALDWLKTL
jgi:hypothetical protein